MTQKQTHSRAPVLRFAPSPTGWLHVGGARTAIFNWLIARQAGGKFLLRIEDTDRQRSTKASEQQILEALSWLGLDWDGQPVYQSQNEARHRQVAADLLNSNKAYRCFCTREELEAKRKHAEKHKINQRYDGSCRQLSRQQIDANLAAGKPFSIRLKVPEGRVSFDDLIHGPTEVATDTLDDFILLRPDGSPTYQLAVVCDDHDMGVTLVLRGDDHIANTPKQILIAKALGWPVARYGHIPLILGPDKQRLSKRHGAAAVQEFRDQGILPEALFNYLCLLGWASGDDREIITRDEMIRDFDIQRINRAPGVFDLKKLLWMNARYVGQLDEALVWKKALDWLEQRNLALKEDEIERFRLLVNLQQGRAKTLSDLLDGLMLFFETPATYEARAAGKHFKGEFTVKLLRDLLAELQKENAFQSIDKAEQVLRNFAARLELSAAKVIHPLRLALTGSSASPGIFELLYILGAEKTAQRIQTACEYISQETA